MSPWSLAIGNLRNLPGTIATPVPGHCPWCGREICQTSKRKVQKYCSYECSMKYRARLATIAKLQSKTKAA